MGYAVLTSPLPLARVARMVSPAVLLHQISLGKSSQRTRKVSKCISSVSGGVLEPGWGGGSLKAPPQRSGRSTRLPHAQRLFTTYKRPVHNPNTAMPLLVFHAAHTRGLDAWGATMALLQQSLALPWRRSLIWPRDMAVE